ncbi:MAG: hypothetical protein IID31_06270 [Planctomycetes bacterium]|nr:hypothetical protein [Planctomycetota bacterium]
MTTAVQPATQRRKLSRDDVLRMGRSGAPWGFVPVAAQVLRLAPDDHVLRAMMAANLAALGLKTAALEAIELLPEEARRDREVADLEQATRALPSDRIPALELIRTCRANLAALPGGTVELEPVAAEWERELGAWEWMRARGGNVVRREPGSVDVAQWRGLCDQTGAAEGFGRRHFATDEDTHGPLTIEGLDPPWIFLEAVKAFPARADGFVRRIRVVQADAKELLDGLAHADLTEPFSSGRVELFVGADCSDRLGARLGALHGCRIQGPYVPLLSLRTRAEPATDTVLRDAAGAQEREHEGLRVAVRDTYADRDARWWRRRYREALGGGEPLRVLVPTCRYSTFIQHSSRDLVGAFERAGCVAELLIEPDRFSHFSLVAYERVCARFEPDLVVLINYARPMMPGAFPDNVPFVCWIQDAMPQLFDEKVGGALGELDFLAGHLLPELFAQFRYPVERLIPAPVVADETKFHPGPIDAALRREHTCEMAFVSHHSETPEQMHARLRRECGEQSAFGRVVDRLRPVVERAARESGHVQMIGRLREATERELNQERGETPAGEVARVLRLYCMPMADRIIRHEALAWAAELAETNGWRLHLYGRGWERHERLARYAKGELAHGEALRASYACAAVHLHMSAHTLVHQRVMECALSGGLPLCRLVFDALSTMRSWGQLAAAGRGEPGGINQDRNLPEYDIGDHAELMSAASQLQRLGLEWRHVGVVSPQRLAAIRAQGQHNASRHNPAWLLGDLAETTFRSRERLGELVSRAMKREAWKSNISAGIGGRVRAELTHDAFVRRVLGRIAESLGVDGAGA